MSERVGYEVTITPDEVYDGIEAYTRRWRVDATRFSDGEQRTRYFGWRWRARRFAQSPRRLSKAFNAPLARADQIERFTVEWIA